MSSHVKGLLNENKMCSNSYLLMYISFNSTLLLVLLRVTFYGAHLYIYGFNDYSSGDNKKLIISSVEKCGNGELKVCNFM